MLALNMVKDLHPRGLYHYTRPNYILVVYVLKASMAKVVMKRESHFRDPRPHCKKLKGFPTFHPNSVKHFQGSDLN